MFTNTKRSGISIRRSDVKMSDRDILKRYLGIDRFPCHIRSPLRDDDDRPSFSFVERGDVVIWKDFGTGSGGDAVALMAKLWMVSYKEALLKMQMDCGGSIPLAGLIRKYKGELHITKESKIAVKVRDWRDWDTEYWQTYGISRKFCKFCNVHPISTAFFTREDDDGKLRTVSVPMDKWAYAYFEWKDGRESIKLYQPFSKTMKWLSKHDSSVWDLWTQAFRWAESVSDEELIITSSRKDAMCLFENLRIPAVSMQGEGYLPKPQIMQQLKDRFKKIYIWYDNDFTHEHDNPGQDNAAKLIALYPYLRNVCIPSEYRSKDPSDLVKNHGKETLINFWNQLKAKQNENQQNEN